jgi:DNA-binding transcriptional ArsR family regulator
LIAAGCLRDHSAAQPQTASAQLSVLRDGCAITATAYIGVTLTSDQTVTYSRDVTDDDHVFKALADPTRRFVLDLLFQRDGRTLKELESGLEMTRFGVMKHLRILENAGLVVTRRSGREKLHFLNPVPIRMIHDRWIDKYREREVSALLALKTDLEKKDKPS